MRRRDEEWADEDGQWAGDEACTPNGEDRYFSGHPCCEQECLEDRDPNSAAFRQWTSVVMCRAQCGIEGEEKVDPTYTEDDERDE